MKCYFLQEDLDQLDLRIANLKNKLKEAQEDKHLSTTQSAETWHDNYGFEEGVRQIRFLANNITKLLEIKSKAYLVNPKKSAKAGIGSIISFKDETGKEWKYEIGSYLVFSHKPNCISYESPMGKILMGAKKGEVKRAVINGKEKILTIISLT